MDAEESRKRTSELRRGSGDRNDNATDITDVSPLDFLASLSDRRKGHGEILLDIFSRATGEEPVMWGPSMIGYGSLHYRYASGREGNMFVVGFSPRKAKLVLYGLEPRDDLGKFTASKACIYVNKPEDINLEILEDMIRTAFNRPI